MATNNQKSFLWSFIEQGSTKAAAMLIQIVLARILSPEDFGILAILLVVTQIADSIAQSGLGLALIQKKGADDTSYDTGFWLSIVIAIALYLIIFLGAPLMSVFYHMPSLYVYLRVLALVVFFNSANSIQRSFMQRRMDFKGLFKISLSAVLIGGTVGVAAALTGLGVWSLVLQTLAQSVATCLVMAIVVPWRPHMRFDLSQAKELYSYGWKICVTGVLNVLYSGVSELIIGRSCSTGELGYYSQGRKYPIAVIGVMTNAIANVLFPAFSRLKDDERALRASIKRSLALGTWIIVPFSFLCAVIAQPLVKILLTEKWLPCVPIFQLTCLSNSLLMLQLVNLRAYMALGRSGLYMKLQIIKVVLGGLVICGTAIATNSIYLTALATCTIGAFNVLAVDMFPAKKVHGYGAARQIREQLPTFFIGIVSSICASAISLTGLESLALIAVQIIVFAAVYLVGSKLTNIDWADQIISMIRSS